MRLVNCKTSLQLKWSKDCILVGTTENQLYSSWYHRKSKSEV